MGDNNYSKSSNDGSGDGPNTVKNAHRENANGKRLFIFAMVFVVVFFIYITFLHPHSSPDYVKEVQTKVVTDAAPPAQAPPATEVAAAVAAEPWVSNPEVVAKGQALFKTNCVLCHGEKGLGDGPAGQSLNPKPRNYSDGKWKQGNSILAIFKTISKGVPGSSMAPYEGLLGEEDRWAVAQFVRSIAKNIVDPTAAEIKAYKEKKK